MNESVGQVSGIGSYELIVWDVSQVGGVWVGLAMAGIRVSVGVDDREYFQ
jgi:hypothetical protein